MTADGVGLKARLIEELGLWGDCDDFPRRDWKYEVQNDSSDP